MSVRQRPERDNLKWKIKLSVYNQNIFSLIKSLHKSFITKQDSKFLDIGCNDGIYTRIYCERLGIDFANAHGVDYNKDNITALPQDRFFYHNIDLLNSLPYQDKSFDLIIINQVLEHTKNIAHIISEINRVSKKGAIIAISVPNLAALHSRFFLLFGKMPLAIQGLDAHVRGFTIKVLKRYICSYGFQYLNCSGGGIYPFWGNFSGFLGRCFPRFSVFFTLIFKKAEDFDVNKLQIKRFHETKLGN